MKCMITEGIIIRLLGNGAKLGRHACNSRTWEAKARVTVQDQSGLHSQLSLDYIVRLA